jgi:DNA-binding transcriptional ArsR family regulator
VTANTRVFAVTKRPRPRVSVSELTLAQRRVHDVVAKNPGITLARAAMKLSATQSSASYQLRALARLGLVEQLRDGRELRHFILPQGSTPAAYVAALMTDPKVAGLLVFLATHDVQHMTVNAIARGAGATFGFTRRTLLRLQEMELLTMKRRSFQYYIRIEKRFRSLVENDDAP